MKLPLILTRVDQIDRIIMPFWPNECICHYWVVCDGLTDCLSTQWSQKCIIYYLPTYVICKIRIRKYKLHRILIHIALQNHQ